MNYSWKSTIFTGDDPRQIALGMYVQEVHNAVDILRDWVDLPPFHWDEGNEEAIEKGPQLLINPHFKEEHTDWGFVSKKSWTSESDESGLAYGWYIKGENPPDTPQIYTVSKVEQTNYDFWFEQCPSDVADKGEMPNPNYDNINVFHEGCSQKVRAYDSSYWLRLYSNPFQFVENDWYLIQFFMKVLYGEVSNVEIVYPNENHRQSLRQNITNDSWQYYRFLIKADKTDQQTYIQFVNHSNTPSEYLLDTVRIKRWTIPRIDEDNTDPDRTFSRGNAMGEGPGEDKVGSYLIEDQCGPYNLGDCNPYNLEDRDFYTYSQTNIIEGLPNHNEIYEIREVIETMLDNNKCQSHCYANNDEHYPEHYVDCGCDEADCTVY